ncbi:MAG: undecaprenyldiphospho-muramoylpentapeptide beta-N-acetylglucosaminyltransferase [Bacilli bacterium]|nr:undecaprenyldiphospho-muramoylpentapeptide beta-N-acetylglucosaminyltransferase [Bacilli bacterium]
MRVVIVAGGTGGHIYPAIAIMNKIKEMEKSSEFLYIGTTDRMEKDIIPKLGIKFVGIEMSGLNRKNIFSNISVLKKYNAAVKKAMKVISEFKPDVVVGAGGYITAPVLYAAHKLKVPVLIHEQNSIPGVSNKFISNFADKICVSLPNSLNLFPKNKVVYTGNPRSEEIMNVKKKSKKTLGFDENKKLVVVVMGSLGSTTMTQKIKELIPAFKDKNYQVLIITGKKYYNDYKDINISDNVKIVPFMDDLICLLKDSDLIVSRAGASTIAEITAIGLPAILVPSPYVTNNHQYKNAKELEDKGACIIVSEDDFSKDKIILEIDKLFDNKDLYENMVNNSKSLGISDSATRIYNEIKNIIR